MLVKSFARLRYLSIPPRKMRLVADMVKDMPVEKALDVLQFTPKIAARHLAKTLQSAASNALSREGTDHLKPEDLLIDTIVVDAAPTAKRIRFQSMGRVFRYRKRFCHLTVNIKGEMDTSAEVSTKAKAKVKKTEADAGDKAPSKSATKKKKVKKPRSKIVSDGKASTKAKSTVKKTTTTKKTG
ncbi:MAG: 50S ribosomal protein L22 [bacterium]|nr:50S ribosomal protein L22 [bacterium]